VPVIVSGQVMIKGNLHLPSRKEGEVFEINSDEQDFSNVPMCVHLRIGQPPLSYDGIVEPKRDGSFACTIGPPSGRRGFLRSITELFVNTDCGKKTNGVVSKRPDLAESKWVEYGLPGGINRVDMEVKYAGPLEKAWLETQRISLLAATISMDQEADSIRNLFANNEGVLLAYPRSVKDIRARLLSQAIGFKERQADSLFKKSEYAIALRGYADIEKYLSSSDRLADIQQKKQVCQNKLAEQATHRNDYNSLNAGASRLKGKAERARYFANALKSHALSDKYKDSVRGKLKDLNYQIADNYFLPRPQKRIFTGYEHIGQEDKPNEMLDSLFHYMTNYSAYNYEDLTEFQKRRLQKQHQHNLTDPSFQKHLPTSGFYLTAKFELDSKDYDFDSSEFVIRAANLFKNIRSSIELNHVKRKMNSKLYYEKSLVELRFDNVPPILKVTEYDETMAESMTKEEISLAIYFELPKNAPADPKYADLNSNYFNIYLLDRAKKSGISAEDLVNRFGVTALANDFWKASYERFTPFERNYRYALPVKVNAIILSSRTLKDVIWSPK
jgi:hypothetical protein